MEHCFHIALHGVLICMSLNLTIVTIIIWGCCDLLSVVMKHHDQEQTEEKGYILTSQFVIKVGAGTWRQQVIQRPRRGAAYWLASYGPAPPSITNLENAWRLAYSSISRRRHFLTWGSLLADDFRLCHLDMKSSSSFSFAEGKTLSKRSWLSWVPGDPRLTT